MIKGLLRLAIFPLVLILYVLGWFATCIVHFSGMLCRLVSGMIFFWIIIGFLTGLGTGEQLVKMLAVGLAVFLLPQIGGAIVSGIFLACSALANNIHLRMYLAK